MILRDRTGDDERAMPREMRGIVAGLHRDAKRDEVRRALGGPIAPRDGSPSAMAELGERAHPGAGDALEVDRSWVVRIEQRHTRKLSSRGEQGREVGGDVARGVRSAAA